MVKKNKTFIQVGDINIHYELSDFTDPWSTMEPETFILYPGYCRNTEFWKAWHILLGRHYRVLSLDARGYGDTTKPPEDSVITPEMLAGDAIGLLDALGIEKAHWVGESTGGALGLVAALEHPSRISSITLLNTAAKMGNETISTYALGEVDQAAALRTFGVAEWCKQTLGYRMDLSHAPKGLEEWVPIEMAKTPTYMAIAAFKLFAHVDLTPRLKEIKVPTLLIVGSKCTERRRSHMAEMRDLLPISKLVELDGYDYGIHFLAPDAVVAEVLQFLTQHS